MVSAVIQAVLSAAAATAPVQPVCNELCVYYANRTAPVLADKRGEISKMYRPYTDCMIDFAKDLNWAEVVSKAEAQLFLDESWTRCEAERRSGDGQALAYAQQQQKLEEADAQRALNARRAMNAYILASQIFQKAGRAAQMSEYVKDMRTKLAPELEAK